MINTQLRVINSGYSDIAPLVSGTNIMIAIYTYAFISEYGCFVVTLKLYLASTSGAGRNGVNIVALLFKTKEQKQSLTRKICSDGLRALV